MDVIYVNKITLTSRTFGEEGTHKVHPGRKFIVQADESGVFYAMIVSTPGEGNPGRRGDGGVWTVSEAMFNKWFEVDSESYWWV